METPWVIVKDIMGCRLAGTLSFHTTPDVMRQLPMFAWP